MSEPTMRPWHIKTGVCRHDHPDTSADILGPADEPVANCWCHDTAKVNAAFIVRACNAHDGLLEAAKEMIGLLHDEDVPDAALDPSDRLLVWKAAIAKAEEQ